MKLPILMNNKTQIGSFQVFLKDNQRQIYTAICIVIFLVLFYILFIVYKEIQSSIKKSEGLQALSSYDMLTIDSNEQLKDASTLREKLSDLIDYRGFLQSETKKAQDQRIKGLVPYNNFLHFLYLPTINIWKNQFTDEIDDSLIGERYLQNNPYGDVELIQKWTDFFKDMGTDQYNTINDITIGERMKEQGDYFSFSMTVQFETQDRRSFLLLLSKLSITSYVENISLMNEFMFTLRENIKKEKRNEIEAMIASGSLPSKVTTIDETIGYLLYKRIKEDATNDLIDEDVINKSIVQTAGCTNQSMKECLYMFREKYRPIPYIAYGIGKDNSDLIGGLKIFLQNLPPLMNLQDFSFEKKTIKGRKIGNEGYKGSISLKVYGKDLTISEVNQISDKLGSLCFANKSPMTEAYSINILTKLLNQLGKSYYINEKRAQQLRQMINYIENIQLDNESLSNYTKVINIFEMYRTLKEGNACDIFVKSPLEISKDTKTQDIDVDGSLFDTISSGSDSIITTNVENGNTVNNLPSIVESGGNALSGSGEI